MRLTALKIFFAAFQCIQVLAQPTVGSQAVIGKVGDTYISEKEFVQRFELLPSFQRNRKSNAEGTKLELLYSLIAEKLLAQEARERKFNEDSLFQADYNEARNMLARDQLYREEISRKVDISTTEINRGVAEAQRELLVSFIYVPQKEDAEFVRRQIRNSKDFETIQIDSSIHAVRDTATVIWGDAEPAIENTAYALRRGEVSQPVQSGDGWYIIRLSKLTRNSYYTSLQPRVLQEKVTSKLRERKERARLDVFTQQFLKDKIGFSRSEPFKKLGKSLLDVFSASDATGAIALSDEMRKKIEAHCKPWLDDTLVVFEREFWTLQQVLGRLYAKGFTVEKGQVKSIPALLNAQLREWVQQELLAQEALRRGLDKNPDVRDQLEMWYQSYLAHGMKAYIKNKVTVSETEVWSYLQSKDRAIPIPKVRIRELRTSSLNDMKEAMFEMQNGATFEHVIQKFSNDTITKRQNGLSVPFPITEREPVGEIAWRLNVGQRYGPVRLTDGFLYFELVAKDSDPTAGDTSLVRRKQEAEQELLRMKQKRTMDVFLAQVGEKRGFEIYQERLTNIKVTSSPMMTFRLLGFGGRMFAVPFVDRQIDWLNIEPPATTIVQ
ncbi:MAG: peptidylprolyl isomerase [Ignavibacteriales bacterium]|nr:peptidylprolyl isomerase [Ignavibacteriales bacterium]